MSEETLELINWIETGVFCLLILGLTIALIVAGLYDPSKDENSKKEKAS